MNPLGKRLHKLVSRDAASPFLPERQPGVEAQETLARATPGATLPRTRYAGEPAPVPSEVMVLGRGRDAAAVVEELMAALADEARVVDCDLTGMTSEGSALGDVFAPIGHYLQHWPGTTLLMGVPDPAVRSRLTAMTYADRMIIYTGCDDPTLQTHRLLPWVQRRTLSLPPTLTAPRLSRDFAADTLREWRLPGMWWPASHVLSEFVTHAVVSGSTDVAVGMSRIDTRVRISTAHQVANTSTAVSKLSEHTLTGLARQLVQVQARGWGVIGGRLVGTTMWAVLEAAPELDGDQARATGHGPQPQHRRSA
jgi:hypothetical protein